MLLQRVTRLFSKCRQLRSNHALTFRLTFGLLGAVAAANWIITSQVQSESDGTLPLLERVPSIVFHERACCGATQSAQEVLFFNCVFTVARE